MRPKAGYVGMIVLLVVLGVVLVLVARAWNEVARPAIDVTRARTGAVPDHGQADAAAEVRKGRLPDLQDARDTTDAHASDVQQALGSNE